jgi:hypothetical protein
LTPVLTWAEFARQRPDLATAGQELIYFFGVGLAFLGTVRKDGGPRVHPVCPVLVEDRLLAFVIPSPKLNDLRRDPRYALHSYPLPENEDVFYMTGRIELRLDAELWRSAEAIYCQERHWNLPPPDFAQQTLAEFLIQSCLLTRTTGHGDFKPRHTVWKATN